MPAKLSENKIIKIRKEVLSGKTKKQVAYEYDVGYSTVKRITRDILKITKLADEEINSLREKIQTGKTKKQVSRETGIPYHIVKRFTKDIYYYNSLPFDLQNQIQD
jgi:DNA invertase Pin-like site-specific DNA recombinase